MSLADAVKANDKYTAQLRSDWIASPADSSLAVTAVPSNFPTIITVGWKTQYETVFKSTGFSGSNSSDYTLTGVTRIKGANANIPEGSAVNCLNNEEYFNQYADLLGEINTVATDAQTAAENAADSALTADSISSAATITPARTSQRTLYGVNALAVTGAFQVPSGTALEGDVLMIRIKDNGTARALTWDNATGGYVDGGPGLPSTTPTGKYLHLGFQYVTANSLNKWMLIGLSQEP